MIVNHIVYILATFSLMTGSILDFNKNDLSSYFFVVGSSLFFVKSCISLIIYKKNKNNYSSYDVI